MALSRSHTSARTALGFCCGWPDGLKLSPG